MIGGTKGGHTGQSESGVYALRLRISDIIIRPMVPLATMYLKQNTASKSRNKDFIKVLQ